MKKFFSLFAAVLFAGSMMAETQTIFTYNGKGVKTAEAVVKAGGTLTVYGGNANIVADQSQKGNMCIKINKGFTKDGIYYYMGITLDEPLQAGDKITTAAFRTGTSACVYGMDFNAEADSASATDAVQVLFEDNLQVLSSNGVPADTTFVVPAAAAGAKFIRLYRKSGSTGLWIANFTITREGGVTPPAPTMNYYVTGSMTNWAPNANYMLTPDNNGLYKGEFTFAANDEFKVTYSDGTTIDNANWFPTGMGNNYTITEAGDYAITFNPAGNVEGWYAGYFQVAKKEVPVVTSISLTQFLADKPTTEVTLKDLTVIAASGKNTYVIDEDGVALVIFDNNKTYYDGTLTAGKVLSGQKATYAAYKGQDEIIPTNAVEATDGVAPVPTVLTEKPAEAQVNRYVAYKNVAATLSNSKYYIFSDVQLYGVTNALKPTAEGNYDVEGIYIVYNNVPEIIVTGLAEAETTAIDNTVVEGKAVKRIVNGQLVIEKNGVIYNAQGAMVR